MLNKDDPAPDFTLPTTDGDTVRLHEQLECGPVVLYFYPADFTPACTAQACMMRDWREQLAEAGFRVLGVNAQSSETHAKFKQRFGLGFTLLADEDKSVCRAYGVLGPLGLIVRRATFLVGADGIIQDRVVADLRVGRHEGFVKRLLADRS